MQWNRINMSKDELKRKQEEYIKAALEASKKAKFADDTPTPVIITIPNNETKEIPVDTSKTETVTQTDDNNDIQVTADQSIHKEISSSEEEQKYEEIITTAIEELTENDDNEESPDELFENVFITEEEAEQRLTDTENSLKEIEQDAPDFDSYIKKHNMKSDKSADE